MPAYNSQNPPPSIGFSYPLHQFAVFSNEAVVVNEFSQQVNLAMAPVAGQKGLRVEIDFSADPGNFEFDVLESDNDIAGTLGYQQVPAGGALTQANVTKGINGANTRIAVDLIPFAGQFCCLFVKTPPSNASIKATARISRAA